MEKSYREHVFDTYLAKEEGDFTLLINAALGLGGEAGEVIELIKKWAFQGKELSQEKLLEELGDVRYYMELLLSFLNKTMEDVEEYNVEKLKRRYSGKK